MMVDDALRVAGRARRVEQRERVPLVERPRPRERRVAFGEQRLVRDAAEPLAAPDSEAALLSPEDGARLLGLHIQTVRGYIRNGRLPAFRIAGERAIRIRRDDLIALLQAMPAARPDEGSAIPRS